MLLLAGLVWHQRLEKDEGYLSATSWLVASGQLPYRDFVFPQQPYFPLLYGLLMRVTGPSLLAARGFSAVLFLILGGLVFAFLRRHRHGPSVAIWGGAVFCLNTLTLFWYPRCRQYVITDLLLFVAFFLVAEAQLGGSRSASRRRWLCGLAGLAAAGALHARLLVGPAALVLAVEAGRAGMRRWSWAQAGSFAAGGLVGSGPFLWLLALNPREWFFEAYTLQTFCRPPFEASAMALRAAENLSRFFSLPLIGALSLLAAADAVSRVRGGDPPPPARRLAWSLLVVLFVTAVLCHPMQRHYLLQTLPYLVLVAARPWERLLARLPRGEALVAKTMPSALLLLAVVVGGHRAAYRIGADRHHDPQLGLAGFHAYQAFMTRELQGRPGPLLTWWPGYLLVTGVEPYPGSELGKPASRAAGRLSPEGYRAHGLRHPDHIRADLRNGTPRWVVLGITTPTDIVPILASHYRQIARFGVIAVYERREEDA